jgi:hypothetical protein
MKLMGRSTKNQKKQGQERALFEMFARDFELPAGATGQPWFSDSLLHPQSTFHTLQGISWTKRHDFLPQ